ncbi:MAG: Hsp20/alpha crystallin family protein [Chitinophagaceae bacterium]|nr:Hsp20/alpha crystallin family protein [Chitinophagaceae bacterium]
METKAVDKPRTLWPALFDSGWIEKFFNTPLDEFFNFGKVIQVPAVNVCETEKDYFITVAAPGMDKKDFTIEADDDLLTISARKEEKEEVSGRYNRREYNYSSWSRSFTLPENCNVEQISAVYANGELKITIPKKEVKASPKRKTITVS